MIAGAVNQAGFKEDRLDIKMLPQTLTGFEDVFQNAKGPKSEPRSPRELLDQEDDPRLRTGHARAPGKSDRPDREEIAGDTYRDALKKTSASARPIQKAPEEKPASPTEEAGKPDLPSKALERRGDEGDEPTHEVLPSMMAQIGATAYQISRHGIGEQPFAEQAGTVPPGESLGDEESLGGSANKLENTVLFAKPHPRNDPQVQANLEKGSGLQVGDTKVQTPVDILNLARETPDPAAQLDKSMFSPKELQFAQTRNELLMQLGQSGQNGQAGQAGNAGTAATLAAAAQPAMSGAMAQTMPLPFRPVEPGVANADVFALSSEENAVPGLSPTTGAATAVNTLGKQDAASRAEQIIQRIVEQARWMIRNNRSEVTFKLQPEHLGEVHLKVTHADGNLRVDMTVDNHGVKHLVESRMHELHNHLQEQQLAQGQFEFNVDVRQGDGFRQPQEFALSNPQRGIGSLAAESHEPAGAIARNRPVWGRAGSGIYV